MLKKVKFFVNINCEAGVIIRELQNHFLDAIIHSKNVYNTINLFWHNQKISKIDAAEMYNKLIQL